MPIFRARAQYFLSTFFLYSLGILIYSDVAYYYGLITRAPLYTASFPVPLQSIIAALEVFIGDSAYAVLLHLFAWALFFTFLRVIQSNFTEAMLLEHRPYLFWKGIGTLLRRNLPFIKNGLGTIEALKPSKEEVVSIRYFLVKFFFLPLMLVYLFSNFQSLGNSLWGQHLTTIGTETVIFNYSNFFLACLLIDTLYFTIGYIFEFKKYSKVRSVEPTLFGWVVALICYPPFNSTTTAILGWGSQDTATYGSTAHTAIVLGIVGALFAVYALASVALGLRASNLTNRGIVSWGPYRIIRHPAYMTKNLGWIILGIPLINFHISSTNLTANWNVVFALCGWAFIYYLRAMTEERHLLADPDYVEYCKKVKYRFIPGVY